jgi:pyruvate kinase
VRTEILATLGPSSLNDRVIKRLEALGVTLFRLNLSHTRLDEAEDLIRYVQRTTDVPLSLDTEGAQIRTGSFVDETIGLRENSTVRVHRRPVPGDSRDFNLYPETIVSELAVGDFVSLDSVVLAQVTDVEPDRATLRVLAGGPVGRNRAVTVERDIPMPPLTPKDRAILAIGRELGIRHVALSFANRASDLEAIRAAAGPDASVISKIECRAGLRNLAEIAQRSDALLIDRGDLSRQVPIERIPATQKRIIQRAKEAGRPVYVATNLMESMVTAPHPTRAEVNDVYNTLMDGADGLVLAAETAIGRFPIECVGMVVKLAREFEAAERGEPTLEMSDSISLLVEPHGGRLVQREADSAEPARAAAQRLAALPVGRRELIDCLQIARGAYSPLTGFMDAETLDSVLREHRLSDGTVWPLPILLQVPADPRSRVGPGDRVALEDRAGTARALLDVSGLFEIDLDAVAELWFGTDAADHPGALRLRAGGPLCVAGEVTLLDDAGIVSPRYALPPAQSRFIFVRKGWNRVVGFHTAAVPRRAHEAAQLAALEASHADGLGRVALGRLPGFARHSPAREAVLTALCHKNLGCSHFALPHEPGVPEAQARQIRELFEKLGDLGIEPVEIDAPAPPSGGEMREIVRELVEAEGGSRGG